MIVLPRMMTVDPSGMAARLVRAALELLDRPAIKLDVPAPLEALDEISRSNFDLVVVSAVQLDEHMRGYDFALRVKQASPETSVIVIGDAHSPDNLLPEERAAAPFLYIPRPLDVAKFVRAVAAGLDGKDVLSVEFDEPARAAIHDAPGILGSIPSLDVKAASSILDKLLPEIGAIAIILSNRAGDVLLERGAVGYFDREMLTTALMPTVMTTYELSKLVGGKASSLGFYDGDEYDVFVLSVGIHHMLSLIFDGSGGRSQFGAVNRYGRRAAEDLAMLIGASAFMVEAEREARATMELQRVKEQLAPPPEPAPAPEQRPARGRRGAARAEEAPAETPPTLEPAPEFATDVPEPVVVQARDWEQASLPEAPSEPIKDLDLSLLDPALLENLDTSLADDLFDMDKLADIANETRHERGPLSYEQARELGIIK